MLDRKFFEIQITEEEQLKLFSKDYFCGNNSNWGNTLYTNKPHYRKHFDGLAQDIIRNFNPKNVLEIGCGVGYLAEALQNYKIPYLGFDIAEWAIRHSISAPWKLNIFIASVLNIPLKDKSFDLVYSYDILEHLSSKLIPQAISELRRVGNRNVHIVPFGQVGWDRDITHITMREEEWWKELAPDFKFYDAW